MIAHIGSDRAPAHLPIGEHIALTASPHVTEALIALLEAVTKFDPYGAVEILAKPARALATAITRRPE